MGRFGGQRRNSIGPPTVKHAQTERFPHTPFLVSLALNSVHRQKQIYLFNIILPADEERIVPDGHVLKYITNDRGFQFNFLSLDM
jgi:hypothetical protein